MSEILCRWLNEELRLSKIVEPKTFAKSFSSGYLIGEILHKYQLQNDFSMFMNKDSSIPKLNNFTRLEPSLQLLGVSFDVNTAQDLMQEKQGVAAQLLYQLYVSLEKKKKSEISGTMMQLMQPAANAHLRKKEHEIYCARLHQVVRREAELKLQKISQHNEEKCHQWRDTLVMTHPIQPDRPPKGLDDMKMKVEKLRMYRQKNKSIMAYNQAAAVQVPKPPPFTSHLNLKKRQQQQQRRKQQAQRVQTEIAQFENNRMKQVSFDFASSSSHAGEVPGSGPKLVLHSNTKYIQDIRQRLEENALAREQREKRRDKFLLEQLKAHEAQEEARREEQLVKRLTRQTQQEQRLAAQLLQIRMQKDVIRENRLFREQQYQQRRERDFQEALEREAALARQAKLENAEEIRKELELCSRMAAERAQSRHKKHFTICKDIVGQIVDLATKVGEYRLLTGNLIPAKAMREWKELLLSGLPLYKPMHGQQPGFEFSAPVDPVELKKQETLKNQDYDEYTNMVGEWAWPEEAGETKFPSTNNNILGHVVQRLRKIVHSRITAPHSPTFPHFTLKACVLGKFCSGKTSCVVKIAEAFSIHVLSPDALIQEALDAYKNGEKSTKQHEENGSERQHASSSLLKPDLDGQEENKDGNLKLSTRAAQGAAAEKALRKGSIIPNELLVDIIVEAVRKLPAQSGWILDGFPADIQQAHLLEKALGGSVVDGTEVVDSRTNLAADPDPPKSSPAPAPVLDLALLLDIPDEVVVRHAHSKTDAETCCSADKTMYLAQATQRISAFQEAWHKLEKWFGKKQNILVRVDADVNEEQLYERVESVLQQVMVQREEAFVTSQVQNVMLESGKASKSSSATPSPVDQAPAHRDKTPGPTESCSSLNEEKGQSVKSLSKSNINSPRGHSRKPSTCSGTTEDPQGVPNNPPESASACPASPSWVYVDEPLPPEIPVYLSPLWDAVCDSYVNNVKTVMQQLRSLRTVIDHHLYNIREEYKHYLGRPDLKQELVSHWQKDFNSISEDMRDDEDTKAELHLRLDELRERLWDISDKRKGEDEQQRAALGEGQLEDFSAVLVNHHSVLMQVELDRFRGTLSILKVYYLSMYEQVLPELPSNLDCIPLLDKDQDKSTETEIKGDQMDEGEVQRKTKFVPFLPKRPESSGAVSKTKGPDQIEPVKPPCDKLISDYEDALTAISELVSAEAHQRETKEQEEKPAEREKPKALASAKKKDNRKQSAKKQKGPATPPPAASPAPDADKKLEKSHDEKVRDKIQKEYAAALEHEQNAAKVRIALVKGHGLVMLHSLHSRAEETVSSMEKWFQERYLAEMKCIDQLTGVVRLHIDKGAKLQNQLVLECTDFYLNGDCHLVAPQAPPARPPPLEKPAKSTMTIDQLQSLFKQLSSVAPSGLILSSDFSCLLRDIISVKLGRNAFPESWTDKNETQLLETASLLTDEHELTDWRRFLLSAALPWPFPSITQLLELLQRFKATDTGDRGYIEEEQYEQTQLWFSNESMQPVSEDPSEPLPYDRLTNLQKFFFQLFADHSVSPPRLDYVSMLKYFAADPNPRQGFIRALSVVSGHHLRNSLTDYLVKSMPGIEEATELSSPEPNEEYKDEETLLCVDHGVSISALLAVICHKATKMTDGRSVPLGCLSQQELTEQLVCVFTELGYDSGDAVPFSILCQHPLIQSLMETSTQYRLVDFQRVLLPQSKEGETNSITAS